jgi:hypothetical protein
VLIYDIVLPRTQLFVKAFRIFFYEIFVNSITRLLIFTFSFEAKKKFQKESMTILFLLSRKEAKEIQGALPLDPKILNNVLKIHINEKAPQQECFFTVI